MTRLIVLQKSGSAKQINVVATPFVIGRAATADLVLDNQLVSRTHAVLETVNEALTIRDLHSHNGTYVNGTRIDSAILRNGDEIRIGDYQIRFLASKGQILDADALRLVTEPGKLADIDLQRIGKA
jgi:pSer/pThr/pTyr-binding forkhead associated (FHA) protein